jgi:hypothetical protein
VQGGFGEEPTHPKPPKESNQLWYPGRTLGAGQIPEAGTMEENRERSSNSKQQQGSSSVGQAHAEKAQEDHRSWAMEVYQACKEEDQLDEAEEDILELDLDEEEEEVSRKHLAMAVYYSRKSFNPKYLFEDMLRAWGISKLGLVDKIGHYIFQI